ncbi:hypothetical protein Cni_G06496 [Canna indica]|uniref:Phosphatidic acid phosphatase type 2/haloperoxidase domain-containing protein n=1 Tax=Canna indica TaxID=4628 RepID=A0AAQ3JX36_9LILI|nr:hypothetical protein Cni_G06496 [Canna indica]
MPSSLLLFPPAALHLPPAKSVTTSSFPLRSPSKYMILTSRFGSRFNLGGGPMVSAPSVGRSAEGIEEDGRLEEAEVILRSGSTNLGPGFAWSDVESVLNRMSKWVVAALFGLVILWKHDAEVLWAAMGSVVNSWISIKLKRILNHERPVAGLRSDPGMPSSHAQSIFYAQTFAILSMVHCLGFNLFTVTTGTITLIFGTYLSWLRVSQRLHTFGQVLVGALLGSTCAITWFWLWNSYLLGAFISSIWVRILVVVGSVTFCGAFMVYVIQNWLKDEP